MTLGRFAAGTHVIAVILLGLLVQTRPRDTAARLALAAREADYEATRTELASLHGVEAETKSLEARWKDERSILPDPELATEEKLLKVVSMACDAALVRVDEVAVKPEKAPDPTREGFDEVSVGVRLVGTYDSLVKVVALIESNQPCVQVVAFSISRRPGSVSHDDERSASLEVVTYRSPLR